MARTGYMVNLEMTIGWGLAVRRRQIGDVVGNDTLAGGTQYGDRCVYRNADGKHIYTLVNADPLSGEAANDVGYVNHSKGRAA